MSITPSRMTELGAQAPPFDLPAANPSSRPGSGEMRSLDYYADAEVLVVVFTCNHCPYAQHVEDALLQTARDYQPRGVAFAAICSNDAETHPEDSFDEMAARAEAKGYPFAYLRDESQDVARAYGAACTPDFFVYDAERTLVYRGAFDESRPGKSEATGRVLRAALDQLLEAGKVRVEQVPSMGCNIKWKAGKAPA